MSQSTESESATPLHLDVDSAVRDRYSAASKSRESSLCCPVQYDGRYLEVLPRELVERDYGCGDPSAYVHPGETVLDLGSGGGKICYIASQVVGPEGRVLGVDINDDMLTLARKYQGEVAQRIGWDNVEFRKGRIQDLALDLERFEEYLREQRVDSAARWIEASAEAARLRRETPLIADGSVDVVLSNCVLNLVNPSDRKQLFDEIFRVLRRGGRAVISDIVSDEAVPANLRNDPELWSGCISGAFEEVEFLRAFEEAGFHGVQLLQRQAEPWAVVEGIEFRSVTVSAYKGKQGPCLDHREAVIYKGPWKSVCDDDGHILHRGERMAVCRKTFNIYSQAPYAADIIAIEPDEPVPLADVVPFDCREGRIRDPRETKGGRESSQQLTILPDGDCCGPDCC